MFTLPLDILLLFTITTPVAGWVGQKLHRRSICGLYAASGLTASGIALSQMFTQLSSGQTVPASSNTLFSAAFKVDALGIFMATAFTVLGIAATTYSIKYMEKDSGTIIYYTLLMAMISGLTGVVFAGDLFTLYVFWELMSIASYVLVAFRKEEWEPVEAGFKYLVMSAAASATILFGLSLLYGMAGTLNFEGLATTLGSSSPNSWMYVAALFILVGFGVKTAVFPLHTWLPDAHSAAPTPVSALLSGIVIETGVYALTRTFFTALASTETHLFILLASLSVLTMFVGNVTALLQNDLKRLLAYSSIGQVGYILAGVAVGTELGLTGAVAHIFNHALMKGTAFLCAGAVIYKLGSRQLDEMSGIGRKMPVTAAIFAISLFALIGMPPLNGFASELTLFTAAVQADASWLGIALILNSVISAAYYLRVLRTLLEPVSSEKVEKMKEAPLLMLLPMCALAVLIVIFGIWPDQLLRFAQQAASSLLGGR